jgi:type VI secretion system protein ImpL
MMAIAFLTLALVAMTWAAGLLLGWPLAVPLIVSACLLLACAVLLGARLWLAHRRAANVDDQLRRARSTRDRDSVGSGREISELQERFRELTGTLRRGQRAMRWSDSPLYALPWYLVLGPPGAGKTAAVQTSGSNLRAVGEVTSRSADPHAAAGCQPWVSDRGVLLDTPGRYVGAADAEWSALLTELRRARRRRPLDGIVLAYSVADLLADRPEQLEEKAQRLRLRLDDLSAELGSVLPVYLLLTKVDALSGFGEFLADLPDGVRDHVWGATLDLATDAPDAVSAFKAEFDLLKGVLHAQLLERLPSRRLAGEACARALRLPAELESIRAPLVRLVESLFRTGRREAALLRGFYFSSSGEATAGAGMALPATPETRFVARTRLQPVASRSAFLAELFSDVVFGDRDFARRSRRGLLLDQRRQLALGAAALALSLFGALPAVLGVARNFALIDATLDDTRQAGRLAGTPALTGNSRTALELLIDRSQRLDAEAQRFSIRHWWGPYVAAPLRDAVRQRYLEQLRAIVQGPLHDGLSATIRRASDVRGLDPSGFEAAFRDLKLYLMLAHPDRLDFEFGTDALTETWTRLSGRSPGDGASTAAHVRTYLDAVRADPSWAWAEDGVLVARARAQLGAFPVEEIRYAALQQAAAGAPPVLPEHIFVGEAARYVTTHGKLEVPGLYTALGWQKVQPLLKPTRGADLTPWVLGEQRGAVAPGSAEQLEKLYFDRYVRAWMDFLVGLDVATPANLSAAIDEMAALDKGEGPYVRLFRRLAENTRLEREAPGAKEQALAKVTQVVNALTPGGQAPPPERLPTPVEQYFRRAVRFGFGDAVPAPGIELPPSLLNQYLDQLRALEVSLRQLQDSGADPSTEFAAELDRASASIERLLAGFDQTERLALEPLLMNPIRGSQRIVEAKGRSALTDRWRVEVWEPYRQLATRYPFVSRSESDVALPDFAEFFRPQTGTLWKFYEENFASRFSRSGDRFVPRPAALEFGFRQDFLQCLSAAREISDGVFVDGAQQPAVPLQVKMQSVDARVSEITLVVDGDTLTYRNEPERWHALQWPGKNGPPGASLRVKGADFSALIERDEGEFGFLRLLAAGNIRPVTPGSLTLEASWRFSLQGADSRVTIQFRASRRRHPFSPTFFSRLNCPPAIASASERH